jgi:hypothetical protein
VLFSRACGLDVVVAVGFVCVCVCVCVLRLFSCDLLLLWGVVRHLELDEMKCC